MYEHHILGMVEELARIGVVNDDNRVRATDAINSYWQDKIALIWTTDDVRAALTDDMSFENEEKSEAWKDCITDEKAIDVLQSVLDNHDCGYGVCWETIHSAAVDATRTVIYLKD